MRQIAQGWPAANYFSRNNKSEEGLELLLYLLYVAGGIQVLYYLFFFSRLAFFRVTPKQEPETPEPVSIIVCARNEYENLKRNLPLLLTQDYEAPYEVLVINDVSYDETHDLLFDLSAQYPRLQYRNIQQESRVLAGKKFALTMGLKAARYDKVLLTDADCAPRSPRWIRLMMSRFSSKKDIVIGYSPYRKYPGLLNKMIRFETVYAAMQYLSFALAGLPYMGVGRNLAYRKKLFFEKNVFVRKPHLLSGDDDLFVNEAATSRNTQVQLHPDSFMESEPKRTWEDWWFQKERHVSTGRYYKRRHQFFLGLHSLSHLLFYVTLLLLLIYSGYYLQCGIVFGARLLLQLILFQFILRKLQETDLYWLFPFLDIFFVLYYFRLFPALLKTRHRRWK